jgi:serine/threonine protein phosphatase PrpC
LPTLIWAQGSDRGRVRERNEDTIAAEVPDSPGVLARKGAVFVLADGLGGLADGQTASREAVAAVLGSYSKLERFVTASWLSHAVAEANARIYALNVRRPRMERMATTLTVSLFFSGHIYIAHVGDSRMYRVTSDGAEKLTVDHSAGRHVLTRAVGLELSLDVDLFEEKLSPRDRFVQCSDGLYAALADNEIARLACEGTPQSACDALIRAANERGGEDNISVQIIQIAEAV